ncbi:MAG: hypothetical protein KA007_03365 [Candidatus Pacebacteria bacterium]|jgi:hypothetical protein|nr:hypothetical protein [Candidatus Levybacteria bacterium]MBP7846455.1 hypothetical protein [Candidatus Paceibacterota bacterium]
MNKKVKLVESVFGITLPTSEIYVSGIKLGINQKEEYGITYAPEWKHESGNLLPLEFEAYLPKEGMTPDQAIKQLDVCSSLGRGWTNDSYKLYSQEIMMQLIKTAVTNCFCLASKDFASWTKKDGNDKDYLSKLVHEIAVFNDAFSRERPWAYSIEEEMRLRYLKLLLENDYPFNKGTYMGNGDIFYNSLFENLFSTFIQRNRGGNEYITRSVSRMLQKKCYDVVEELEKTK